MSRSAGGARKAAAFAIVGIGLCLALAQVEAVEVYRSLDEEGVTSFSQSPPARTGYEILTVRPLRPPVIDEPDDRTKFLEAREQRLKDNCRIARENLRILRLPQPLSRLVRIRHLDEQGNFTELDEAQIRARQPQAAQDVRDACG